MAWNFLLWPLFLIVAFYVIWYYAKKTGYLEDGKE